MWVDLTMELLNTDMAARILALHRAGHEHSLNRDA